MNVVRSYFYAFIITLLLSSATSLSHAQEIPYTQPDFTPLTETEVEQFYSNFDPKAELPTNNSAIHEKHISDQEIIYFVKTKLADIMTFDAGQMDINLNQSAPLFTVDGYNEFTNFLQQSGLYDLNMQNNNAVTSIIVDDPVILNQASMASGYRWLLEAIVLTSPHDTRFRTSGFGSLITNPEAQKKHLKELNKTKRKYVVQVQLTRIPKNNKTNINVAFELFSVADFKGEF